MKTHVDKEWGTNYEVCIETCIPVLLVTFEWSQQCLSKETPFHSSSRKKKIKKLLTFRECNRLLCKTEPIIGEELLFTNSSFLIQDLVKESKEAKGKSKWAQNCRRLDRFHAYVIE